MGILDRDRHPLRFAVVASVVSGLVLASVIAIAGLVTRTGLLTRGVPMWSLVAVVVVTIFLVVTITASRRRTVRRTFLILPAFSQKHWLAELIKNSHRALDRRGMDVLLKLPDEDYSAAGQAHHLRNVLSRRPDYLGGFIVPVGKRGTAHDLVRFCERLGKPVVMVDVEPFEDERSYPSNAVFVGYDPADIGEKAANWVVKYLAACGESDSKVLVVCGPAQEKRQDRFVEVVAGKIGQQRIAVLDDGRFARLEARTVVSRRLREFDFEDRKLAVIFCTNDEMALGAVDALLANGSDFATTVAVVGVDGTPEARALIDTGRSPLRATVVQSPYDISEEAVDLFTRLLDGQRVRVRTLLPARVYEGDGRSPRN